MPACRWHFLWLLDRCQIDVSVRCIPLSSLLCFLPTHKIIDRKLVDFLSVIYNLAVRFFIKQTFTDTKKLIMNMIETKQSAAMNAVAATRHGSKPCFALVRIVIV